MSAYNYDHTDKHTISCWCPDESSAALILSNTILYFVFNSTQLNFTDAQNTFGSANRRDTDWSCLRLRWTEGVIIYEIDKSRRTITIISEEGNNPYGIKASLLFHDITCLCLWHHRPLLMTSCSEIEPSYNETTLNLLNYFDIPLCVCVCVCACASPSPGPALLRPGPTRYCPWRMLQPHPEESILAWKETLRRGEDVININRHQTNNTPGVRLFLGTARMHSTTLSVGKKGWRCQNKWAFLKYPNPKTAPGSPGTPRSLLVDHNPAEKQNGVDGGAEGLQRQASLCVTLYVRGANENHIGVYSFKSFRNTFLN